MAILKTIKVKHPDGYQIINEVDFDKAIHKKFTVPKPKPVKTDPHKKEPAKTDTDSGAK